MQLGSVVERALDQEYYLYELCNMLLHFSSLPGTETSLQQINSENYSGPLSATKKPWRPGMRKAEGSGRNWAVKMQKKAASATTQNCLGCKRQKIQTNG